MKHSVILLALLLGACFSASENTFAQKSTPVKIEPLKKGEPPVLKLSDPLPANLFVELARVANPAVVNISTKTTPRGGRMGRPGMPRDPLMDLMEQLYGQQMRQPRQQQPMQALGSGFIIRDDGLIVTNNHVIAGADLIQVQLTEKDKLYDAKLIGADERTDIALIKIESKEKLPTVQLGSSQDLQVGEWVAAFGNPFGNGHTMTKGIVSAKGRAIGEINRFPLIQTDTPINPGNSGGPLINSKGLVVGVNSAIDARAQGIGFAIPIDEVRTIIPQLEKVGSIRKGYLGVGLGDLDPQAAAYMGIREEDGGAVIMQIERNSPAARAGFKTYDIVTEFNGRKIKNSTEFRDAVADAAIGSEATAKIIRDGKSHTLKVSILEQSNARSLGGKLKTSENVGQKSQELGFSVANVNDTLREEFGLSPGVDKPVVTEVERDSRAAEAGLMPGDVVLDVNKKDVRTAADVLKQIKKGSNVLRIARGGGIMIVVTK